MELRGKIPFVIGAMLFSLYLYVLVVCRAGSPDSLHPPRFPRHRLEQMTESGDPAPDASSTGKSGCDLKKKQIIS